MNINLRKKYNCSGVRGGNEEKGRVLCALRKGRVFEWKKKEKGGGSHMFWGKKETEVKRVRGPIILKLETER